MVYTDGWCYIQSTPRDDGGNGAHTKDPLTEEAAMSGEMFISYMICAEWLLKNGIFFRWKSFPVLGSTLTDDSENGAHKGFTVTDDAFSIGK